MIERENMNKLSIKKLKDKAIEVISNSLTLKNFMGSDGWAMKFCSRNSLDIKDEFNCPRYIPR